MAAPATIARQVAVNCETRKIAYRQTKDGVVVSFVIHPQEVPDQLAIAPLGTRYMLALVELGDDEKPKGGDAHKSGINGPVLPRPDKTPPVPPADKAPGRAPNKIKYVPVIDKTGNMVPKTWDSLPFSQQAGIRCNEPAFWRFLEEYDNHLPPVTGAEEAGECVRLICGGIISRRELKANAAAAGIWQRLDAAYQAWQREAEVVPT